MYAPKTGSSLMGNAIDHSKQHGFTLIELLISLGFSAFILTSIISIFLPSFTASAKSMISTMLEVEANSALSLIERDMARAGYQEGKQNAFLISGAKNPIEYTSEKNCVSYGFYDGKSYYFRSFYFKNGGLLGYLSSPQPSSESLTLSSLCTKGNNLFDTTLFKVSKFVVNQVEADTDAGKKQQLSLELDISTLDEKIKTTRKSIINVRNVY